MIHSANIKCILLLAASIDTVLGSWVTGSNSTEPFSNSTSKVYPNNNSSSEVTSIGHSYFYPDELTSFSSTTAITFSSSNVPSSSVFQSASSEFSEYYSTGDTSIYNSIGTSGNQISSTTPSDVSFPSSGIDSYYNSSSSIFSSANGSSVYTSVSNYSITQADYNVSSSSPQTRPSAVTVSHISNPRLRAAAASCSNADQVPMDIFFGYDSSDKTTSHKTQAISVLNSLISDLFSSNKESYHQSNGDIQGYMWVGSMVQNAGFLQNILPIISNEVSNSGMPKYIYIEYMKGDPMKGFGVMLNSQNNPNEIKKVAKLWSQGKTYGQYTGSKTYSSYTVCYLSYANRKPILNDEFVGDCDYVKMKSGMNLEQETGIDGESLQGYNPTYDFSKLQVDQPICRSIGKKIDWTPPPTCKDSTAMTKDFFFGYNSAGKTDARKSLALDILSSFSNSLGSSEHESYVQTRSGAYAYMWVGAMVQNSGFKDSIMKALVKEVQDSGMPNFLYLEYKGDTVMQTAGVILVTNEADKDLIPAAAKAWSQGKSLSTTKRSGSKTFSSETVCFLDYNKRKQINTDQSSILGDCLYVKIETGKTATEMTGLDGVSLAAYNPDHDMNNLVKGEPICYTIGKFISWTPPYKCSNSDQVIQDIKFAYTRGTKTDQHKTDAINSLNKLKGYMRAEQKESYYNRQGDVNSFIWSGSMVQNEGLLQSIIPIMEKEINTDGIPVTLYIEYMPGDPMKSFGIIINTENNPDKIKKIARNWSAGKAYNTYDAFKTYESYSVCYLSYADRKGITNDNGIGNCDYVKMEKDMDLAAKTGVNADSIKGYNADLDFSALQVGQPICYTMGSKPDLRPKKNSDGSCHSYKVSDGDTCSALEASYYPLSQDDLNSFNQKTYGWYGCSKLMKDQVICLSDGSTPKPTPDPKAECGPLAPGDLYNSECPNKACCSEFGFCGLTSKFCDKKSSDTNAPGTTGCFSNCGYGSLPTRHASSYNKVAYWLDSDGSMYMDPSKIGDEYNIVHYSFATLNSDFSISVGSGFQEFLSLDKKKIVSFGGWDFSTSPSTYDIFRKGVSDDYRSTLVSNIVKFVNDNNLDGVHFDWEYPGAPDIPGIPAGDVKDGQRYSDMMKSMKDQLGNKLVSVALPASYWYLKNFPLSDIDKHIDYYVLMNYDYHGQWDYGKFGLGIGCHVDYSETTDAIKMIVKSGIDTTKVYGGLANYGRSFKLKWPGTCETYGCSFTGPDSGATAGNITQTPGVLAISEINALTGTKTYDSASMCNILTYNQDTEWVAWMSEDTLSTVDGNFKSMGLGGSALWVYNYYSDGTDSAPDDDDDWEEEPDDDSYIDIYNCKDVTNFDLDNLSVTCAYEQVIRYILNNATTYNNVIKNVLNDYDNYLDYYEAYTRSYYDAVMLTYEDWVLTPGVLEEYFTINKTVTTDPNNNKRDISEISQSEVEEMRIDLNITEGFYLVRGGQETYYIEEDNQVHRINMFLARGGLFGTVVIDNQVILDQDKQRAANAFAEYSGINISTSAFVERSKEKRFEHEGSTYVFSKSTILDSHVLYPNVLSDITMDNVTSVNDLVNHASASIGYEDPLDIYEVVEGLLVYSELGEIANITYVDGKKQKAAYDKEKKLMILEIVLGIVGGISLFFGPTGMIISSIVDIAQFIGVSAINGEVSVEDFALSLVGIFLPVFEEVAKSTKFADMLSLIRVKKDKNFDNLNQFKYVKEVRTILKRDRICKA